MNVEVMWLILLLIIRLWSRLSTAEVFCNNLWPQHYLPSMSSCNFAIARLVTLSNQCGHQPVIWSGLPSGPGAVRLPLTIVGQGAGYTPPTNNWCTVLVLWQPRPGTRLPPPTLTDFFPLDFVVNAARQIRDQCLAEWPWAVPSLGRQWILPNEWVDVQLGVVFGPGQRILNVPVNGSVFDDEMVTVHTADGSNRTIRALAVHESSFECSRSNGFKATS